jgi:hypothetical protein
LDWNWIGIGLELDWNWIGIGLELDWNWIGISSSFSQQSCDQGELSSSPSEQESDITTRTSVDELSNAVGSSTKEGSTVECYRMASDGVRHRQKKIAMDSGLAIARKELTCNSCYDC